MEAERVAVYHVGKGLQRLTVAGSRGRVVYLISQGPAFATGLTCDWMNNRESTSENQCS